jgi:heme/copper-type cytochrome/quinol oxidase subunit 2
MIPETELKLGDFRLIEVDNKLMLPINHNIRTIVSSNDVIHSFALPSMGVKIDAIPGRLNQIFFKPLKPGFFTGGCSEICGANHSYMPITARVVSSDQLSSFLGSVE